MNLMNNNNPEIDRITKEIITEGFGLSFDIAPIFDYTDRLMIDYSDNPDGALKDISLNLEINERHFAAFILGTNYAPIFKKMNAEELAEFQVSLARKIDIEICRLDTILGYFIKNIIRKMKGQKIVIVVKKILSTKLSENEKDFILFSFGMLVGEE